MDIRSAQFDVRVRPRRHGGSATRAEHPGRRGGQHLVQSPRGRRPIACRLACRPDQHHGFPRHRLERHAFDPLRPLRAGHARPGAGAGRHTLNRAGPPPSFPQAGVTHRASAACSDRSLSSRLRAALGLRDHRAVGPRTPGVTKVERLDGRGHDPGNERGRPTCGRRG